MTKRGTDGDREQFEMKMGQSSIIIITYYDHDMLSMNNYKLK